VREPEIKGKKNRPKLRSPSQGVELETPGKRNDPKKKGGWRVSLKGIFPLAKVKGKKIRGNGPER